MFERADISPRTSCPDYGGVGVINRAQLLQRPHEKKTARVVVALPISPLRHFARRHGARWMASRLASLSCILAGCGGSQSLIVEQRNTRVEAINARCNRLQVESAQNETQALQRIDGLARFKVEMLGDGSPKVRVDQGEALAKLQVPCRELEAARDKLRRDGADPIPELDGAAAKCWQKWAELYASVVVQTYPQADKQLAWRTMEESNYKLDIESVFAASHNSTIGRLIMDKRREVKKARQDELVEIERLRRLEISRADVAMQTDLEEARRQRWATIGAALQAFGNSLSASGASQPQPERSIPAPTYGSAEGTLRPTTPTPSLAPASSPGVATGKTCSSDFECGIGWACIKPNFSTSGTCLRSVNEYGNQQYNLPRLDSVAPKMPSRHDCHLMDCPIGFRCDTATGACVK